MKNYKIFFFLGISFLFFSSCEDVIDLELETTDPRIVIEANLNASEQIAKVRITKSNDFYDNDLPENISGAEIMLQNGDGAIHTLKETEYGNYEADSLSANPGDFFTMKIEVEGQFYEATSQVPYPVPLNNIGVTENETRPFGSDDDGTIMLTATWDDQEGIENFYRIRTYVDNVFQPETYTLINDDFVGDGKEQNIPIRNLFEENSTVTLELLSTDENYYDYFFQVSSVSGEGNNSTTPFNPLGNFDNDALGYFGIYYSSALSVEL